MSAVTALGFRDQELHEQLLSLLSAYPKEWLKKHFGFGRVAGYKAIDHAAAAGPRLRLTVITKLTKDGRTGPKEELDGKGKV
jgi:hypothetical protein